MSIEIISIEEDEFRCRTCYIYNTRIKNSDGHIKDYLIDFNHKIINNGKGIEFVKREDIDYKASPFECAVLSVQGNGNHTDDIYAHFNGIFQKQEGEWRK